MELAIFVFTDGSNFTDSKFTIYSSWIHHSTNSRFSAAKSKRKVRILSTEVQRKNCQYLNHEIRCLEMHFFLNSNIKKQLLGWMKSKKQCVKINQFRFHFPHGSTILIISIPANIQNVLYSSLGQWKLLDCRKLPCKGRIKKFSRIFHGQFSRECQRIGREADGCEVFLQQEILNLPECEPRVVF